MNDNFGLEVTQERLEAIDSRSMNRLARSLTGRDGAVFTHWRYAPLRGGAGGGMGGTAVYRFTGEIQDGEATFPASLILKVLYAASNLQPGDNYYWKREVHAYQSGLLTALPGRLVAPRCFGVVAYPDSCWLWLEEITDSAVDGWSLATYQTVAHHLGQFNGSYLQRSALPDFPWLARDFIRQDSALGAAIPQLRDASPPPDLQQLVPDHSVDKLRRLWDERDMFLEVLDRLPKTLCHFDAFRRNLFIRPFSPHEPQTVAVDWSFLGLGPVGAELVSLIWVTLFFGDVAPAQAAELDRLAFEGYIDGLREAGWTGDAKLARLGYTAAIGLRRIGTLGILATMIERNAWKPDTETIDAVVKNEAFIEELVDEARSLIQTRN